jgi:hypothetical protein
MTGARIMTTLINGLQHTDKRFGLAPDRIAFPNICVEVGTLSESIRAIHSSWRLIPLARCRGRIRRLG